MNMKKVKEICNYIFVEEMTGMAWGLFSTLIIGLIISQIGTLIGGYFGNILFILGKVASAFTGAGIGIGVALKSKAGTYAIISGAIAGMIGAFATSILNGKIFAANTISLVGPGEPLGAFIAAAVGIEFGKLLTGKTKLDLIIVPFVTITIGGAIGLLIGPSIAAFMQNLGSVIVWATDKQPILMGIVVSVIMGIVLTLPISSAALSIILNLSGLAAGAATVGCAANMIGFAVASFKENKIPGLISQGLGTSMLQVPNIMKKPVIWLPAIIASAILGPLSTTVFKMSNIAAGAGMGTAGLVGPITTWQTMSQTEDPIMVLVKILLMYFIFPAIIAFITSLILRKTGIIQTGDMELKN